MNFFKQLSEAGTGLDVSLRIKEKNGKLTVMVTPEVGNQAPFHGKVITATPEELDSEFFTAIKKAPVEVPGATVQDLPAEKQPTKTAEPKKENKAAAKQDKKDKQAKKKAAPAVQERSMFDQPADPTADEPTEDPAEETRDEDTDDSTDETDSENE